MKKTPLQENYDKIVSFLKQYGKVYEYHLLEFIQYKIKPSKVLIYDCNNGAMYVTETNEIGKKTDFKGYFYERYELDPDRIEKDVENLLNELLNQIEK